MASIRTIFALTLIIVVVLLVAGCVGQLPGNKINLENSTAPSKMPVIYTAPIGGFEITDATLVPNTTFETNYTFYSRNWGPGEVNYSLSVWYMNASYWCCASPVSQVQSTIQPSTIFVEPNHSYTSKVSLTSDTLPKEFFTGFHYIGGGSEYYSARLNISVRLGDNSTQFADDQVVLLSRPSRPFVLDTLSTDNCSIIMNHGEKKQLNLSYVYYQDRGLGKINITTSQTPVNITITPSDFIVKHGIEFPFVLTISAGAYVPPKEYPVDILINGDKLPWGIHCRNIDAYQGTQVPSINMTIV